ncbi:transcriptional regulator, LysR family-like protein [Ramlibacter tataouinensis TTB310]|uniref:Transcriptional regulator, LysR family-like protein n=2 Tax=Ramlibacter tataouinensis TaxID=94132 RepID=F5Y385_RAMTT|nr:transcriptional regulator, LysR family-like protein [Ramlibacter tataouinensis TTB310]
MNILSKANNGASIRDQTATAGCLSYRRDQRQADSAVCVFLRRGYHLFMDHKWLEDFVVLARERSFSRAAEQRHVTQPQFSRRIRALELWVGADLINRAGLPLSLTPAGEELLPVARRALAGLAELRERIRGAQAGGDWVTLATGRTLSRTVAPAWLQRVQRAAGGFRLRILTGSIHEGATALEQGAADFLLTFSHPRLPLLLDEARFEGLTVGTDELVAVSAPRPDGRPLHALPGTERRPVLVLGYAPTLALHQILQDGLGRRAQAGRELHLRTAVESDFAESLHEQALQGVGLAWLPRALVATDLQARRLVAAEDGPGIAFEIRLLRPRQPRNALVQTVWTASSAG